MNLCGRHRNYSCQNAGQCSFSLAGQDLSFGVAAGRAAERKPGRKETGLNAADVEVRTGIWDGGLVRAVAVAVAAAVLVVAGTDDHRGSAGWADAGDGLEETSRYFYLGAPRIHRKTHE